MNLNQIKLEFEPRTHKEDRYEECYKQLTSYLNGKISRLKKNMKEKTFTSEEEDHAFVELFTLTSLKIKMKKLKPESS